MKRITDGESIWEINNEGDWFDSEDELPQDNFGNGIVEDCDYYISDMVDVMGDSVDYEEI